MWLKVSSLQGVRTTDQLDACKLHIWLAALQRAQNEALHIGDEAKQAASGTALSQGIPILTSGLYRSGQAQLDEGYQGCLSSWDGDPGVVTPNDGLGNSRSDLVLSEPTITC